jgi:hypothetical protein
MDLVVNDLSYVLFPGGNPQPAWIDFYKKSFQTWHSVWSETFLELDGNAKVFSDDFTRQSLIGAIMAKNRCVGLGFFNLLDFRLPTSRYDSYFKVWPDSAIEKLLEHGPSVVVGSNITVPSEYRGDLGHGVRVKTLILGLMVKTLCHLKADVMTGTMRCNRGMHTSAYQFGGSPIQSGVVHHGVEVDLVAFYRRQLTERGEGTDLAIEALWRNRLELGLTDEHERRSA